MNLAALAGPLRPMSLWSPVGLVDPQPLIDVSLEYRGQHRDVTGRHVVLSLAPLVIAIGDAPATERVVLVFRDRALGRPLGTLQLLPAGVIDTPDAPLACYSVDASLHRCLPSPLRVWQRLLQARRTRNQNGMQMCPADVQHLLIFYICPRPVLLVSAAHAGEENLFPMDLVGEIGGGLFTLALRNSSPSVATLEKSRRAALADVAARDRALAYSLGAQHNITCIDWSAVPCQTSPSAHHGLRVPATSPRIREVEILALHRRGSHTVFICQIIHDERRANISRLFHTSGIHQAWRRRQGALPWDEASA